MTELEKMQDALKRVESLRTQRASAAQSCVTVLKRLTRPFNVVISEDDKQLAKAYTDTYEELNEEIERELALFNQEVENDEDGIKITATDH